MTKEPRQLDFSNQTGLRAAIFDVDGTLYHQKPVRLQMVGKLARFFLFHPWKIRELLGIFYFRKLRETEAFRIRDLEDQISAAAKKAHLSDSDQLKQAIDRWMFREPLAAVAANGNKSVLTRLMELQNAGKRIIIYSDYAPEEKLAALNVRADAVYYPGRNGIDEMKPSAKAMAHILRNECLTPEEVIYFGDRDEKDGAGARMAGMRYIKV